MEQNIWDYFIVKFEKEKGISSDKYSRLLYNSSIPLEFEQRLDLIYIAEGSTGYNLCMANSEEVRAEFRTTFTERNLQKYIRSFQDRHLSFNCVTTTIKIPYPTSAANFWKRIKEAQDLEKNF